VWGGAVLLHRTSSVCWSWVAHTVTKAEGFTHCAWSPEMFLRTSLLSVGVWGLRRNERPSAGLGEAEKCATGDDFFRLTSDIAPVALKTKCDSLMTDLGWANVLCPTIFQFFISIVTRQHHQRGLGLGPTCITPTPHPLIVNSIGIINED
jgi:hypothetical protein